MESSKIDINALSRKLYFSRIRIMSSHPFFGVILHDLKLVFNTKVDTFATNGETIFFNPYYLKDLSDFEVDVCLLHVLIHISLKHHLRYPDIKDNQILQRACDIVTNSNMMYSLYELFEIFDCFFQSTLKIIFRLPIAVNHSRR